MEKYTKIRFLNKGSYGKIYLVQKKSSKRNYALKSIKILGIDRYNKISILNEIKILLTNNNEFLLKCYDLFIHDNNLCIITDFIDNGDLDNYIKNNKSITEEEIYKIFLKICVGINSLHHNDIVHRDLKPANILITKSGDIKVCDFGICKFLGFSKLTNTMIGTPYFMSPEQMGKHYYDYKIDVWGIGCILFELLYKKHPFNGRDMYDLKRNIKNLNPLRHINSKTPLEKLLKDFFEKNRHRRLDLNVMLNNSENKKLLDHYGIQNEKKKFKSYSITTVPYSENDWNKVLKGIKDDFNLPNSPVIKNVKTLNKDTEDEQITELPNIVSYAEIKRRKLKPISREKPIIREKSVSREIKKNNEVPKLPKKYRKKWDIDNMKKKKSNHWRDMYKQGKPLPEVESRIKHLWAPKKDALPKVDVSNKLPKVLPKIKDNNSNVKKISRLVKAPYGYYYRNYDKLDIYENGNNWYNYGKKFNRKPESKWVGNLRKY
jgi:serine/threonine protein kinase